MKRRHVVLVLLFLLSIITYIDRVCIAVAGPRMQADLDITPAMWGWVTGVFTLSYAAFEIPCGMLADRIGARAVLTRIVLWWSAFTTLTGAVSNFSLLLLTRFCFGAGEAGAYPSSASVISRWFPPTERARATGAVWMASRIGGALSPLLVVPIQQAYGWRMSFYVFGVIGVVWCVVWYAWYRNHPAESPRITARELEEIGTRPPQTHHGLPWGTVLQQRNFWLLLLMYHLYCWGGFFYLSWLPTYLQKGREFSEDEMKIWTMLPFVFGACGNLAGGMLSDFLVRHHGLKFGRRLLGATGLGLSALFMFLTSQTGDKMLAVLFLSLGYASMDCMLPVAWAVCLDIGGTYAGSVSGCMNMAGQAGSFLTAVAFGYIVSATGNYHLPLAWMSVFLIASAFLFACIDPTRPLMREPGPREVKG